MKTRFGARDSLITNELGFVHQADLGKSHFDSVPKGQNMANAKYLRKRIALVAAAALGVGMIVAAPAFAAQTAPTAATMTSPTATSAALANVTSTFTTAGAASTVVGDSFTAVATVVAPTGSSAKPTLNLTGNVFASATAVVSTGTNTNDTITYTSTATYTTTGVQVSGTVSLTPDIPGKYIVTVTSGTGVATFTVTANTAAATFVGGTAQSGSGNSLNQVTGGLATFNVVSGTGDTSYVITTTGVGNLSSATSYVGPYGATAVAETAPNAAVNQNGTSPAGGVTWKPTTAGTGYITLVVSSSTAGTTTVVVTPLNSSGTPGTAVKGTATWGAAPTLSTQYTTAYINSGTTFATSPNQAVSLAKAAGVSTGQANIGVTIKDGTPAALNGQTVSVTVSGPGLVSIVAANATGPGTARVASTTLGSSVNTAQININADGTAGVGTFTVSVGSTVIATKTVAFYGGVAKSVATQNFAYAKAGSTLGAAPTGSLAATGSLTDTPAVNVSFTDANGNAVAGVTTKMTSSNTAVIVPGTCTQITATPGTYECSVTGATGAVDGSTATVTFSGLASDGVTYVDSAPVTFTIGKSTVATVTMAWDAATYAPGSKAVLTITAKDAAGGPVADHTDAYFFTAALSSSVALSGTSTLPGPSITFINGKKTVTVYTPLVSGPFTVSGTIDGANADATATGVVSATATVTGSTTGGGLSAADSAAIAAAKAAADAATAAVAALSTTVASLVASITAQIRALSAMIQKLLGKSGGSTPGLPKTGYRK
jgi:hypothetical protein